MRISEQSNGSDEDKDAYEESDKERNSDESQDGDTGSEEEEGGHIDEPVKRFAVTPFLSGVLPAGRLRVKLKPVGSQADGLIQVRLMHLPLCVTLSMWFYLEFNLCISAFTGKWQIVQSGQTAAGEHGVSSSGQPPCRVHHRPTAGAHQHLLQNVLSETRADGQNQPC